MTRSISQNEINEEWFLVDAAGLRIGDLASKVAELLLGKTDPKVRANLDPRKKVVVVNSEKLDVTPKKTFMKFYKRYSGYPGGLKVEDLGTLQARKPAAVIEHAVKGMLPKNKRGNAIFA